MGAAEDKIIADRKKPKTKLVVTPSIAKRYGVKTGATSVDQRTATAMREGSTAYTKGGKTVKDPATTLADEYVNNFIKSIKTPTGLDMGTGAAAPAAPSATTVYNRQNTITDRNTVAPILANYGTSANAALTDRYNNYLNALNQGNIAATGQINTATQNLLNSLPTTYKPATTPTWLQPQASSNAYQQYLASTGAGTTDIGNLQQYANATAQNATNMYQGVNQAQNAIQQNYLDSLRAGASSQGAAALQALANTQAGQKAAAEQVYGTSKANILQTLLPLLVANPTTGGSDAFKIGPDPSLPIVPATTAATNGPTDIAPRNLNLNTPKTPTASKNPLANAPTNPKPNQKYNVGKDHYVWKADKKTWVKSKK
jgi:hypothetical protein